MNKFYDVFEIFQDLDTETVELFGRADFDIEDIHELELLKSNISKLDSAIDEKISSIYNDVMSKGFDNE
ncbi:hypothetical protein [Sulfurimonas xiamenensis]|uniref:Uncharacterized protein n=1 Tax=Sulfurimonas xiamenensis TaxID=2590021 RepID=A0AAJ4A2X2_9BACT|nr:hypothetical protein [Sulfurimonas xiamenensis]QFR42889.1 hypothetical protein FJR47_02770 [Sulfurimonas xiamenensis]